MGLPVLQFSVCVSSLSWCPEELACTDCCFSPDFFFLFNQVSKTTLDGENELGEEKKKKSMNPRITFSLVMIYPVPLLILQLSKSTLYAWMTHGLYLNQINVSATSDRSSAQLLEWQMSKVHVFSLLSFLPFKPSIMKGQLWERLLFWWLLWNPIG